MGELPTPIAICKELKIAHDNEQANYAHEASRPTVIVCLAMHATYS